VASSALPWTISWAGIARPRTERRSTLAPARGEADCRHRDLRRRYRHSFPGRDSAVSSSAAANVSVTAPRGPCQRAPRSQARLWRRRPCARSARRQVSGFGSSRPWTRSTTPSFRGACDLQNGSLLPDGADRRQHGRPRREFEEVRWVSFEEAPALLSFDTERSLVGLAAQRLPEFRSATS